MPYSSPDRLTVLPNAHHRVHRVRLGVAGVLVRLACAGPGAKGPSHEQGDVHRRTGVVVLAIVGGFFSMKMFFDILVGIGKGSPPAAVSGPGAGASAPGGNFTAGQTADRDGLQITTGPQEDQARVRHSAAV